MRMLSIHKQGNILLNLLIFFILNITSHKSNAQCSGSIISNSNSSCLIEYITLSANNLPLNTHVQWRKSSQNIFGATEMSFSPTESGTYDFFAIENDKATFQSQSLSNQIGNIRDVQFIDSNNAWCVGKDGKILRTTNGGITWGNQSSGVLVDLNDVHFIDLNNGWIAGDNATVLKTTNGGNTWEKLSNVGYNDNNGIFFMDQYNGWVVGNAQHYKTTNGGSSWRIQNWTQAEMNKVYFINSSTGWIASDTPSLMMTKDGGVTWEYVIVLIPSVSDIFFIDNNNGWAVGKLGYIIKTTDGGLTWTKCYSGSTRKLNRVVFTSLLNGWAVGEAGTILHTSDGGLTWRKQENSLNNNLNAISQITANKLCIVGDNGTISFLTEVTPQSYCPSNAIILQAKPPQPIIIKDNCVYPNTLLLASGCTGNIIWNTNATGSVLQVTTQGTYTAICNQNGCMSEPSSPYYVRAVNSGTISSNGSNCAGEENTLNVINVPENSQIQWRKNNILIENQTNATFTTSEGGNYDAIATYKDDFQWSIRGPLISTFNLYSVHFNNPNEGWALGDDNKIFATKDGGKSWKSKEFNLSGMTDLQFMNENNAFAIGFGNNGNMLLKSTDKGETWSLLSIPASVLQTSFWEVFFVNQNVGWLGGWSNKILKTTNGGLTWFQQTLSEDFNQVSSLFFLNENIGWATDYNYSKIFKTVDGGNTWNEVFSGINQGIKDIKFTDINHGWAVGELGTILYSSDGGNTWIKQQSPVANTLTECTFLDENIGWIVGFDGIVLRTTDGGINWALQPNNFLGFHLQSVSFVDNTNGFAVGWEGSALKTKNGGITWENAQNTQSDFFFDLHFFNKNKGLALGTKVLASSTDGGENWSYRNIGATSRMNKMTFVNDNFGWIVGGNGLILKTIDGGTSWVSQNSGISTNLQAVQFFDINNGYAVGNAGVFLKTTNGGTTWTKPFNNLSIEIQNLFFVNQNTGWVIGINGAIMKTSNGGQSWSLQYSSINNPNNTFNYGVYFVDENNGWVVGNYILHTTDGGITWTESKYSLYFLYHDVYFTDLNNGWVVGDKGIVLQTTDGGITWTQHNLKMIGGIYSIFALNNENIWMCGSNDLIVNYNRPTVEFCPTNSVVISRPNPPNITSNQIIICNNEAVTLNATNCLGNITWSNSFTGTTISVGQSGNYTAICQNAGCNSTNSNSLNITSSNSCPSFKINPSKVYICPNTNISLTTNGCTGKITWSNGFEGNILNLTPSASNSYTAFCYEGGRATIDVHVATSYVVISNSETINNGINEKIQATASIQAANKLMNSPTNTLTNVSFQAGKKIILNPGFEAYKGTIFNAEIKNCPN